MIEILESIGIAGFLDILFMTLIIYSVLVWFKRTRAGFAAIGLFMVGAAYLIARQLGMSLTTTVFQGFFAIILIAIVIIFQQEIRRYLEQLVSRSIFEGRRLGRHLSSTRGQVETLVSVANDLARAKIGAIIVLRGKDPIARYLTGGVSLDGKMSESLIGLRDSRITFLSQRILPSYRKLERATLLLWDSLSGRTRCALLFRKKGVRSQLPEVGVSTLREIPKT
jgi:diadenylate cyclase